MERISRPVARPFAAFSWLSVLLVSLLLAACQPVQPAMSPTAEATVEATASPMPEATMPEVTIEVNDTEFSIPADFPGGIVAVTVKNNSSKNLEFSFVRVHEGSSVDEIMTLSKNFSDNVVPLSQMVSFMYSFTLLEAGGSGHAIIDFKTGTFIVDAVERAEEEPLPGTPHIFGTFEATTIVGTVEPTADVRVELDDFAYVMPDEIPAGEHLWEFTNIGQQWHMIFFVQPVGDASVQDVLTALMAEGEPAGPPPFEFIPFVGVPPISPGERVWVKASMEPGTYVGACPLPDMAAIMAGGAPMSHLAEGMHRVLTVTGDATGDTASMPSSTIPQVTITAQDFAFDMPAEIPAGLVDITFTNAGATNHHGYVMRLLEGVTQEQVMAAMAADGEESTGEEPPAINDLAFFLPDTDPGTSNQATVELAPGNWMIVSFSMDPSTDGEMTPDWARGSIQQFTVTEATESAVAPDADIVVSIGNDDFDAPAELTAGEHTIQVVNASDADDAYAFVVKLGDDTTV